MTLARGQSAPTLIERQAPFHVIVAVPRNGNLVLLDARKLAEFVGTFRGMGRSKREMSGEKVKFCFGTERAAKDFARRLQLAGVDATLALHS